MTKIPRKCVNDSQFKKLEDKLCLASKEMERRLPRTTDKKLRKAYRDYRKALADLFSYLDKEYLRTKG